MSYSDTLTIDEFQVKAVFVRNTNVGLPESTRTPLARAYRTSLISGA